MTLYKHALSCVLFFFIAQSSTAKILDRLLAYVGETPILLSEVKDMQELFKKNPTLANFYGLSGKKITQQTVTDLLITEAIIRYSLKELNATVQESDIQKQIQSIATQNNLSVDQLRQSLKSEGILFESYRKNIKLQLEKKAIFEREIRNSTSNVSEAELKADFRRLAQPEWKIQLWVLKNSPKVSKIMREESNNFSAKKKSLEELKKDYAIEDLGWVDTKTLNPEFKQALKNKNSGDSVGPIIKGGMAHVLFIESQRQGSDEQFQAMKESLIRRRQGNNIDELFSSWVERRRKEIQVVINK